MGLFTIPTSVRPWGRPFGIGAASKGLLKKRHRFVLSGQVFGDIPNL